MKISKIDGSSGNYTIVNDVFFKAGDSIKYTLSNGYKYRLFCWDDFGNSEVMTFETTRTWISQVDCQLHIIVQQYT